MRWVLKSRLSFLTQLWEVQRGLDAGKSWMHAYNLQMKKKKVDIKMTDELGAINTHM